MLIGVPKEIKTLEHRVGLVPSSVREFVAQGHEVIVESGAGVGINFDDSAYEDIGAEIVSSAAEVFERADMIVKVKEPQEAEWKMLRRDQILFTYLHLAADKPQTIGLMESGCVAIAYETVTDDFGHLPLLTPMSEVAGRLSVMVGAESLMKHNGGCGRLISGAPGTKPAEVLVIGGGVAGFNAARMAVGLGANVTLLERNHDRLRYLDDYFRGTAQIIYSNADTVEQFALNSDLIIGAVLIPGLTAPKLVSADLVKDMKAGTVLVDIAIDQGGCFETSRATTHAEPTYIVDDVVHYCVANMPGAVPLSSALALNHAVLPYALEIANKGWERAVRESEHLKNGLNVCQGKVTCEAVALSLDLTYSVVVI